MKRLLLAAAVSSLAIAPAFGQSCKAASNDGKALSGAAKTSFLKKCCDDSAKSADGKMLAGAAKKSYIAKCMKG